MLLQLEDPHKVNDEIVPVTQESQLCFSDGAISLVVKIGKDHQLELRYFGLTEKMKKDVMPENEPCPLISLQATGEVGWECRAAGVKEHLLVPGSEFIYKRHREFASASGKKVEIDASLGHLRVTVHWQFIKGAQSVRAWLVVSNTGDAQIRLGHVSSFFYGGLSIGGKSSWAEKSDLLFCRNSWCNEYRWSGGDIREFGLQCTMELSTERISIGNTGSWSAKECVPVGMYTNREAGQTIFWQIESSGSWNWEIGNNLDELYLSLRGPNERDNHWSKWIGSGESFVSIPVVVGATTGGFNGAVASLTSARRSVRPNHWSIEKSPVIFNDYMNCLGADPTSEREYPYIRAARELGAEVYVIDAGWYANRGESWWSTVGEWLPSTDRFDHGLPALLDDIRRCGMIPGLWLEPEVMGIDCQLAKTWPRECFFMRHGVPVICRGRFQLDFRHKTVRDHANAVAERLISEYGVGYLKLDYNIEIGVGTEESSDSFGDGLLEHNRAYLAWLESLQTRFPEVIVENCSSGGLRCDYAILAKSHLHSVSDQSDIVKLAKITALAASVVVPEQLGIWLYPKATDSRERVIMNCASALVGRIFLSGEIAFVSEEIRALLAEAIGLHKTLRAFLPESIPSWPLGHVVAESDTIVYLLHHPEVLFIVVWNFGVSRKDIEFVIPQGFAASSVQPFPQADSAISWRFENERAIVALESGPMARACLLRPRMSQAPTIFRVSEK